MKVSYSKVLVHGVIATTLLMAMSCQKKGSPRGVQPQTATQADKPETNVKAAEPKLDNIPGAKDPTVVTGKDENIDSAPKKETPEIANKTSEDPTTVASPVVVTEKKSDAAEPAVKNKINISPIDCPESIVKASSMMSTLYKKMVAEEKLSTTSETDKVKDYTAFSQLCLAWPKLFTTEKIESCGGTTYALGIPVNLSRNAKSVDTACVKFATELKALTGQNNEIVLAAAKIQAEKMKSLRAEKFVVSDQGKEMFNKENARWNMYIVDGELQTDTSKLTDALSAKKVACTITKSATDKFTHAQNVIVSITTASALEVTDHADKKQNGVLFGLRIKASDKDCTAEEAAQVADQISEMFCMNLDNKNINVKDLKKALGQHIAVAKVAETKVEVKTEKQVAPIVEIKK